jgi:phosphoglycolate phosphatase-like HAD superfamily hydrolase
MTAKAIAVLFDIDGTLITTGGAGAVAWRSAFLELYGIPADIGAFSDAGMTDPEVGRKTFTHTVGHEPSDAELDAVMAARLRYLPDAVDASEGYCVLPGVPELLRLLARRGYLLGLTTGGVEPAARIKLSRARLNPYFAFGGFGSDSENRTELTKFAIKRAAAMHGNGLKASSCLVVGDTPLDIAAAQGAGAIAVGVASGHYDSGELRAAGADHVIESLEEGLPL